MNLLQSDILRTRDINNLIKYIISTKEKNDKTYVNCYIKNIKFKEAAPAVDMGSVLDLDSDTE